MAQTDVPPPAVIPEPTFADVQDAAHALLLVVDNVAAHTQSTPYLISARALIVNAMSQSEAHFAAVTAIANARAFAEAQAAAAAQPTAEAQ